MAHLTEYSFHQLIERIEIEDFDRIDKQFFKSNIYDNGYLFYFFNQFELKRLFKEKLLLSGDDSHPLVYKEVPQRADDLNYILEIKGKVRYHKNNQCIALNRGFQNFNMPEPVVRIKGEDPEKHKKLVSAMRNWFNHNNYTVERYIDGKLDDKLLTSAFNKTFPKQFGIAPIFISQSDKSQFQWFIEKKSTGTATVKESFRHDAFLTEISSLIEKREEICNGRTLRNLSRYDFLLNKEDAEVEDYILDKIDKGFLKDVNKVFLKNYGIDRLRNFWKTHVELKNRAFGLLSDYFKWTYNYSEKSFNEIFLEDFNLARCSLCYENQIEQFSQNEFSDEDEQVIKKEYDDYSDALIREMERQHKSEVDGKDGPSWSDFNDATSLMRYEEYRVKYLMTKGGRKDQ